MFFSNVVHYLLLIIIAPDNLQYTSWQVRRFIVCHFQILVHVECKQTCIDLKVVCLILFLLLTFKCHLVYLLLL
jgi:hypothetical protein